jgi:hypothetical protein
MKLLRTYRNMLFGTSKDLAGWCSGNDLAFYFGGARFESLSEWPTILTEVSRSFRQFLQTHSGIVLSRVMVMTIDGVGLTTGFIGFLVSYTQLQCTHFSRPQLKATLHSLQWQRLLSLCSTALSWLTPSPRTSCRPDSSSLTGHQLILLFSSIRATAECLLWTDSRRLMTILPVAS